MSSLKDSILKLEYFRATLKQQEIEQRISEIELMHATQTDDVEEKQYRELNLAVQLSELVKLTSNYAKILESISVDEDTTVIELVKEGLTQREDRLKKAVKLLYALRCS